MNRHPASSRAFVPHSSTDGSKPLSLLQGTSCHHRGLSPATRLRLWRAAARDVRLRATHLGRTWIRFVVMGVPPPASLWRPGRPLRLLGPCRPPAVRPHTRSRTRHAPR